MKVAVIGSGVSGLVSAYLLERRHEVTVFEASKHVGGHVYTVEAGRGRQPVDMGFIVYNERTYPVFSRLLRELDVATEESCMSFSVRADAADLEYSGRSLGHLFSQRRNLVRPSFYRMLSGIMRFNKAAPELLDAHDGLTLGQYLERKGLSGPFVEHYLLPMTAAIWSTPPRRMLDFPARTMARFLHNHGLLSVDDRPQWRVISGGSKRWVEALQSRLHRPVQTGAAVRGVRRTADGVEISVGSAGWQRFDAVVMALHSDQALACLHDPTPAEEQVLGAIPYLRNRVTLHTDPVLMPRRRRAWASWNYHLEPAETNEAPRLTYWMNRLQNIDGETPWLVTLNSDERLARDAIVHSRDMAHPQFGAGSDLAKSRWHEVSRDRTFYAGAYWGFGFHEDGAASGVRVAEALGVRWADDLGVGERAA